MAFTATLGFEEGCTILSYDGANAFNSIYRHRFLLRANPPVPGARAVLFIEDITVILPPELSLYMAAKGKVTE